ncbi:MAG: spore coat protein [bacterium]|nr:spore coat protein [bacterium]
MTLWQKATELTGAEVTDQVIASDLLGATKLACAKLTAATLEATTPEVRRFFQDSLNEHLQGHERLFDLATRRGWYEPYASPQAQLDLELRMSKPAAERAEHRHQ